ncbi:MAG: adenylosuccinate lyase [Bacilli bacterium]|jgi:adenylosuccinate lyase
MIGRYAPKDIEAVFTDESRFGTYLEVEEAVLEGWEKIGRIPKADVDKVLKNAHVDVKRIQEIELVTKHDVVAFTRQVSETLGEEKKWVHYGLTSTDVVDTAMGILYKKADEILDKDILSLLASVKEKALEYEYTPEIGRTHGMHSEVTSFGLKFAGFYDELSRDYHKFQESREELEAGKISGAVGNFANVEPEVQDYVCNKFGLTDVPISTQVLDRDRHAYYSEVLTLLASTIEKICLEIRLLSQSEIQEVEEGFANGQKGSSAMPQKRNPISSENLTGCARMMRGYLIPALEDNALFHERDISHSSVERVAFIDSIELSVYMVRRMKRVIDNLRVFPSNMERNIKTTHGAVFSQHLLTRLIEKGMVREKAYDLIQPLAMKAALGEIPSFEEAVKKLPEIKEVLSVQELDSLFTYDYYLRNVDAIYKRVGLK